MSDAVLVEQRFASFRRQRDHAARIEEVVGCATGRRDDRDPTGPRFQERQSETFSAEGVDEAISARVKAGDLFVIELANEADFRDALALGEASDARCKALTRVLASGR